MKGRISMTQTFRTRVENICILILFCLSLGMFALSFLHRLPAEAVLLISTEMDWMVQRASAVFYSVSAHSFENGSTQP